ncbi:hypothetical protein Trydic_g14758 [Trypoxylus dichotomus]
MQSPQAAEALFETTMFTKVFIWFVIVIVVNGIMVPIYDLPPRPPYATYQNYPPANTGGYQGNGYHGIGNRGNGYQVRAAHDLADLSPTTNEHSFSAESSEIGRDTYPAYNYHVHY